MSTIQEMLDALKEFDTPSITNVVATYPDSPLCLGLDNPWSQNWYTDQTIRCMYPEMGPVVGYAVTCVYGLPDPTYKRLSFMDVVDALDASPKPTIFIFEQRFPPEIAGKVGLSGGNMTTAMKAGRLRWRHLQRSIARDIDLKSARCASNTCSAASLPVMVPPQSTRSTSQ